MSYDYAAVVDSVIGSVVAQHAGEVDRAGTFPRGNIEALARAGLLGLPRWRPR